MPSPSPHDTPLPALVAHQIWDGLPRRHMLAPQGQDCLTISVSGLGIQAFVSVQGRARDGCTLGCGREAHPSVGQVGQDAEPVNAA